MTGGAELSARERGRARAREQALRVGRVAGPSKRAGALRAGRSAGPSRRKEGESALEESFALIFKNVNSVSICLFH
jgi:hypothetical protein